MMGGDDQRIGQHIMQRETQHLIDEIRRLHGRLAELEWEGAGPEPRGTFCPACEGSYWDGHVRTGCWLAEEIAGEWPISVEKASRVNGIVVRTILEPGGMIEGVKVVEAPQEATIDLQWLCDNAGPNSIYGVRADDFAQITIANQVVYQAIGWDNSRPALLCRLVEDRRNL